MKRKQCFCFGIVVLAGVSGTDGKITGLSWPVEGRFVIDSPVTVGEE